MMKWDSFWQSFDAMMGKLPGAVDEALRDGRGGAWTSHIVNGDVTLEGRFTSLRINGYAVRVPGHVMRGKKP